MSIRKSYVTQSLGLDQIIFIETWRHAFFNSLLIFSSFSISVIESAQRMN